MTETAPPGTTGRFTFLSGLALLGGPLLTLITVFSAPPTSALDIPAWRLIGLTLWMIVWWITEVVPIPATALLPIPFMPLLGIAQQKPVTASYAHPLIFLFLGGFLLAASMQRWGLHRRIALSIVNVLGTSPRAIIGSFMLATAFLSMWISNTATTIMMFAVGLSLIQFLAGTAENTSGMRNFGVALMLGIAYGASIGGVGTLVGTPPNALLAGFLAETYDYTLTFASWMLIGVPFVIIMLPAGWFWMTRFAFPLKNVMFDQAKDMIKSELDAMGIMSGPEKTVMVVFVLTALSWIFRKWLVSLSGVKFTDTTVAMVAASLLFVLPASLQRKEFVLDWKSARKVPFGVLFLFGGGLALAGAFKSTGLAQIIGNLIGGETGVSIWPVILAVTVTVVFLTELTSNTATTATFLPIMGAIAVGLGMTPLLLTIPVALSASAAFMLPVATPPNAIVFAYEEIKVQDMVKAGIAFNIMAIILIMAIMRFLVHPMIPSILGCP